MALLLGAAHATAGDQRIPSRQIVEAAREALGRQSAMASAGATLEVIGAPQDVDVPAGTLGLVPHAVTGRWPRPRVGVPVDIRVGGRTARVATVWFAVSMPGEVETFAAATPAGTRAEDIRFEPGTSDLARLEATPVTDPSTLHDMRLRRGVREGDAATLADFEPVPDVDRRQPVRVDVAMGAVRLHAHGVAQGAGDRGEVVAVLVDGAEAPVKARIVDRGVVEVVP